MTFAAKFLEADAAAWFPADHIPVSTWAERHRVLGARVASEPGPYRLSRTPYLREIHDAMGDSRLREVIVCAPAQSGKSEMSRNWLGWIVDMSPGPVLIVFPNEASAKENTQERVFPMFEDTPRLSRLKTGKAWDMKRGQITLSTCTIYVGWAGSPQALASRPVKFCLLDEVDKFPRYSGREADPVSLARVRLRTYGRLGKLLLISTPTIPTGTIWRSLNAAPDRRVFHVPCPECRDFAEFAWDNVRWEGQDESDAEALLSQLSGLASGFLEAYYECPTCKAAIPEAMRAKMVDEGEWVSEGYPRGERPPAEAVAYRISGLSTPWTGLTELAREWVAARLKGLGELQHFYNSMLGLPFWGTQSDAQAKEVSAEEVWAKSQAGHKRCEVPAWATVLVAAADTGKETFQFVVRAYGRGYRSRLIDYGECMSFSALRSATIDKMFPVDGSPRPVSPMILVIDSGGSEGKRDASRTEEVYRFALTDPELIKPLKGYGGAGTPLKPVVTSKHEYKPDAKATPFDVTLSSIDTNYFKDLVCTRIQDEDKTRWEVFTPLSRDYVMQMAAERKTLIERRIKPDGEAKEVWRWVVKATGAANHFWDAEVYSAVAAYMLEADRDEIPKPEPPRPRRREYDEDDNGGWWSGSRGGSW
jgi:phage terminase large subunit GpA-like protein